MSINIGVTDSLIVVDDMLAVELFGRWVGRKGKSSTDYVRVGRTCQGGAVRL